MGFFGALGKVLAGKPVYGPEDVTPAEAGVQPAPPAAGGKVIPVVRLTRVECPVLNGRMDLYVDIHNESQLEVYIDRVQVLGGMAQVDAQLHPGQARQFHVYSGSVLRSDAYKDAEVQYRIAENRDYFSAHHDVRFHQEGDGTWRVTEFRLVEPIKDLR